MSFNKAVLRSYAQRKDPSTLPPNVYFTHTSDTVTIFDAYPKAHFHFLVLPRLLDAKPLTTSALSSLKSLFNTKTVSNLKDEAGALLSRINDDALAVKSMIEVEMISRFGFKWGIIMGFHAVQSMDHIHLHVISEDLCALGLKTKKHYNSFHPKLGFFLHLDDVRSWFEKDKAESYFRSMIKLDEVVYEKKLKEPLTCLHCPNRKELKNMPLLKDHLQGHFNALSQASKKKKRKRETPPLGIEVRDETAACEREIRSEDGSQHQSSNAIQETSESDDHSRKKQKGESKD